MEVPMEQSVRCRLVVTAWAGAQPTDPVPGWVEVRRSGLVGAASDQGSAEDRPSLPHEPSGVGGTGGGVGFVGGIGGGAENIACSSGTACAGPHAAIPSAHTSVVPVTWPL